MRYVHLEFERAFDFHQTKRMIQVYVTIVSRYGQRFGFLIYAKRYEAFVRLSVSLFCFLFELVHA